MTDQPVTYDVTEGVATITLNRPDAMNSLDVATKEALRDAVTTAADDEGVRAVVLTGSGRAFCVGQDLKEHVQILQSGDTSALFDTVPKHYNPIVQAVATMPKPVIAAVNGVAAGAGASLAFACDFRVLADTAGFNLAFTGIALSCDTGASWTLPRLVGRAKAIELLYFPRTIPAAEAEELGLATRVVSADDLDPGCGADQGVRGGTTGRGALGGPRPGDLPGLRGRHDGDDRRDPGPPPGRGVVRRQGEAPLRGPLTASPDAAAPQSAPATP
jgi:2-(1,2-epoxy-1,2-dihydrophenyl)acetyl-CoA isomerase